MVILPQSADGEDQHSRIFTKQNGPKWTARGENEQKSCSFTTEKNGGVHSSRTEWPLCVGEVLKTMSFAMQTSSRLHHSAAEWHFLERL